MKTTAHFGCVQCKQKGIVSPILLVVGVVVLIIVAVSVSSGAIKFEGYVSKTGDKSSSPSAKTSVKTKTYQDKNSGVSMDYPSGWSVKENPAAGVIVAFGSPQESSNDTFVDNINLSVSNLSSKPDMTLDGVSDLWQKQTEEDLAGGTFKVLETRADKMAGQDAERLVYSYSKDGRNTKGMVVIALKDKKAYIVTYTAEEKSFDKFLNAADTIVSSLRTD